MFYTADQIIKSLRACANDSTTGCDGCAFCDFSSPECDTRLKNAAADMIEELTCINSENMHDHSCGECSRFDGCKAYVDESETFPEVGGCSAFRPLLKVVLDDGAKLPTRAHSADAGLDLYSMERQIVPAKESAVFDTGVHVAIPVGYYGDIRSKSGLNFKAGVVCSSGTIDAGYTGSIRVKLYNHSGFDYVVEAGDKICQLVILPIITPVPIIVESLDETDRGDNGFGSSGK